MGIYYYKTTVFYNRHIIDCLLKIRKGFVTYVLTKTTVTNRKNLLLEKDNRKGQRIIVPTTEKLHVIDKRIPTIQTRCVNKESILQLERKCCRIQKLKWLVNYKGII